MGRLSLSSSRLGFATHRTRLASDQAQGLAPVQHSSPWKAWYKTARWRRLREQVLIRDAYTCQRTGQILAGKHPAPDSPVVNHKRPHRGDERLFWDIENLETVSKAVHDTSIQAEEQVSRHTQGVWT